MLPSEFDEVQNHSALKGLLAAQVDMQFKDLRALLLFPRNGIEEGFNLTIASIIFNLIAGCSVCFYNASLAGR